MKNNPGTSNVASKSAIDVDASIIGAWVPSSRVSGAVLMSVHSFGTSTVNTPVSSVSVW